MFNDFKKKVQFQFVDYINLAKKMYLVEITHKNIFTLSSLLPLNMVGSIIMIVCMILQYKQYISTKILGKYGTKGH